MCCGFKLAVKQHNLTFYSPNIFLSNVFLSFSLSSHRCQLNIYETFLVACAIPKERSVSLFSVQF